MTGELVSTTSGGLTVAGGAPGLPSLIARAGAGAERRFLEFFAAQIRNRNTREAYLRAVRDFLDWTEAGIEDLLDIEPLHVAAWVEIKKQTYEAQSVKQQLAALRHLFDWLVTGHVLHTNPASFVRGPKFSYTKGRPLVAYPGNPSETGLPARCTNLPTAADLGREVALLFEGGDPHRPLLIGLVQHPERRTEAAPAQSAQLDEERIVLRAEREIVLTCGKASITLTRAGKVLIRCAYLLSRSSGVNRIKGGSVQIN
ncbi:MAG: site-specific integrase [Thiohalocapsa sp. PB-PSB1]|jgi:hypothetical protein|nr:MAG: hypothetical protein N838_18995 [Thiohalocapsa sp. PB-PSB1]QQO54710.1 MAG: site-specific integrase [Thiohalocapsa sp. PB-PSB1]HCS90662.1 hypothetical protein [Chromatiaceae bacterium]